MILGNHRSEITFILSFNVVYSNREVFNKAELEIQLSYSILLLKVKAIYTPWLSLVFNI